jgi:hypothetical protein
MYFRLHNFIEGYLYYATNFLLLEIALPHRKRPEQTRRVYLAIRSPVASLSSSPAPRPPFPDAPPETLPPPISPAQRPGGGDGGGRRAGQRHGRRASRRHPPPPARGAHRAPREAGAALGGGDPPALHRLPRHLPQPAQPSRARGAHQDLRCVTSLSCPCAPPFCLHAFIRGVDLVSSRGFGEACFL